MSGSGGEARMPTLSQKGETTTTRQNQLTNPEVQERGKTRAAGRAEMGEDEQEICNSEKGKSFLKERLLVPDGALLTLDMLSTM